MNERCPVSGPAPAKSEIASLPHRSGKLSDEQHRNVISHLKRDEERLIRINNRWEREARKEIKKDLGRREFCKSIPAGVNLPLKQAQPMM